MKSNFDSMLNIENLSISDIRTKMNKMYNMFDYMIFM